MEAIIGLVLAYSLLSIVVSTTNELVHRGLSFFIERCGRSGFLRQQLELLLAGNAGFVQDVLSHPLVDVLDSSGRLQRETDCVDAKNLTTAIIQKGFTSNPNQVTPILERLPQTIVKALNGEKDPKTIEEIIEAWVKKQYAAMTKLYKNNQYIWSFLIGLFIFAIPLNIDTVQMTYALWKDPTLRAAVVAEAGDIAGLQGEGATADDSENARLAVNDLLNTNLPIRWRLAPSPESSTGAYQLFEPGKDPRVWGDVKDDGGLLLSKIIGIVVTAIAASLGSDFWFNLLRNLTSRGGSSAKNE